MKDLCTQNDTIMYLLHNQNNRIYYRHVGLKERPPIDDAPTDLIIYYIYAMKIIIIKDDDIIDYYFY